MPMLQSIWSVRLYQVKPTIGAPEPRSSWTLCHCRHSQREASAEKSTDLYQACRVGLTRDRVRQLGL